MGIIPARVKSREGDAGFERGTIVKKYARRDFLKTAAVGTAAIAVLPSLTGLAGVARADGEDDGKRQFSFVVLMKSGTSEIRRGQFPARTGCSGAGAGGSSTSRTSAGRTGTGATQATLATAATT